MPWPNHPLKRILDASAAALLLLLLSPLLILLAAGIRFILGSPVLFTQVRLGKGNRLFTLVKFRTMHKGEGPDQDRVTPFGNHLRTTGLDELPELWNILKGDMSFVGPRPLLPEYQHRYSPQQARRHLVRPGLTGLAQIQGRNQLDWEDKFRHDLHYVDHATPAMDLKILLLTLFSLHRGGAEPTEPFQGSPKPPPNDPPSS